MKGRGYGQPDGVICPHDLWVDDGALFDVIEHGDTRHLVKRARAKAQSSRPILTEAGFTLDTAWSLPCALEPAGRHVFFTVTQPRATRARPGKAQRKQAEGQLRPVARIDAETFRAAYGLRNITESINAWFKKLLGNTGTAGRAMRLDVRAQALDHLCAMLVLNAVTFERYRRDPRA